VFAARFKAARFIDVAIATASVQVDGDTAYETGTNCVTVRARDAPPVTRSGRYLTVWKRQPDGVWRIRVDAIVPDPSP
jgi:ketosteroid isomerase-like protein